jgi:hypothetical protein
MAHEVIKLLGQWIIVIAGAFYFMVGVASLGVANPPRRMSFGLTGSGIRYQYSSLKNVDHMP